MENLLAELTDKEKQLEKNAEVKKKKPFWAPKHKVHSLARNLYFQLFRFLSCQGLCKRPSIYSYNHRSKEFFC
jgi:hypothetical protein